MYIAQEPHLKLKAASARELMVPVPLTVHANWHIAAAAKFLYENRITAAPVVDETGHPVGVISQTDIVRFVSEGKCDCRPSPEFYEKATVRLLGEANGHVLEVEPPTHTPIAEVMTPVVCAVTAETPAFRVIDAMLSRNIHRLFVVDGAGALVGVISALDILANLCD